MAKSVDAADLKSVSRRECGFKSRRPHPRTKALAALLALTGCQPLAGEPTVPSVVVIGPSLSLDADGAPGAVLRRATAQGLTRWDAAGVVTPGLASRWIVLDDGLTAIVRVGEAQWPDGRPVRAGTVVERLRQRLRSPGDSATVRSMASAVERIQAVTPAVIELRLKGQRPDLLTLLAQPEFALLRDGGGSGPLRALAEQSGWTPLAAAEAPDRPTLRVRAARAASALARQRARETDLVLGGTLSDAPLARTAGVRMVVDPVQGLFGLAVRRRTGLLATAEGREAVALALDPAALVGAYGVSGWSAELDGTAARLAPDAGAPAERIAVARQRVSRSGTPTALTIAPRPGPGGRLLVAVLTRQLARVGIALSSAPAGRADLLVIDAVAPSPDPASELALIGCGWRVPCGPALTFALDRMADQPSVAGWTFWREQAVRAAALDRAFLPLARPLRWSAAADGVAITPNARAIHPLTALIAPPSAGAP